MPNSGTSPNSRVIPINVVRSSNTARPRASRTPESPVSEQTLIRELESVVFQQKTLPDLLAKLAVIICQQADCLGLWVAQASESGQFETFHSLTGDDADAVWETASSQILEVVEETKKYHDIRSRPISFSKHGQFVIAPVHAGQNGHQKIDYLLVGCFADATATATRLEWLMGIVSQSLVQWFCRQTIEQSSEQQRNLFASLTLITELNRTESLLHAAIVVVNQVRKLFQVDQASITIDGKLLAISDVEYFDSNESVGLTELACNQSIADGTPKLFIQGAQDDDGPSTDRLTLETYCQNNGFEACICLPFVSGEEKPFGALLVAAPRKLFANEAWVAGLTRNATQLADHLDMLRRAHRGPREIVSSSLTRIRKHPWSRIAVWIALGLAILMAIPLPYRVKCDCELQPVLRRFVAAPHEGLLEETLVKVGEIVAEDQLLARLDGRQLRIELAGLEAEYAGAKKRRDSALAEGNIAQSQIAATEMERHDSNIELINRQLTQLEIRSPTEGIVVSGDLEKVEGAPLEMGQTLFEIAPLDQMVGEIAIPESEIPYTNEGLEVAIKLSAFPFETWTGKIERVHPRAEIVNDESVFIAEVSLPNHSDILRPGMQGTAKISSGWSPLGWNLFHRPWEAVRCWTIW